MRILCTTFVLMLMSAVAHADRSPCLSDPPVIEEIVQNFADRTGTKFVLDPRVRAKVNLYGLKVEEIDYPTLIGIFNMHAFTALESHGVTYVVPDAVAPALQEKLESEQAD